MASLVFSFLVEPLLINNDTETTPANTTTKLVINGNPNIVTFLYFFKVFNDGKRTDAFTL